MKVYKLIDLGVNQTPSLENIFEQPFITKVTGATNGQVLTWSGDSFIALDPQGGGGGQNIYNSDGTLTGNRVVDCDNRNVSFDNYRNFSIRSANNTQKNIFNLSSTNFPAANIELYTEDQNLNKVFGIRIQNFPTFNLREIYVGDISQNQNKLGTLTNIVNNTISTFYNNNNIGLKLDFANSQYSLGDFNNTSGSTKIVIDDTVQKVSIYGSLHNTGDTILNTLTATTISATTYLNLPLDVYVTGGTYTNGNIIFRNNAGGSFGVTGLPIGGAGGQVYYLNLSQSQNGYQEFSPIATNQPEQTTGVTINALSTETIASFLTPVGYPNTNLIPSGVWSFYLHSYKDSSSAEIDIFCEIYLKDTGGTETLLLSTDPAPVTSNSPVPVMEITDGYYSGRTISVDDRILVKVRATNNKNNNHTITFLTEGNVHYSYGVTPFTNNTQFTCDDITGCTVINDIQVSLSNKVNKSGDTMTGTLIVPTISATTYYGDGYNLLGIPKWYAENSTPPSISPIATGPSSIAFGSGAQALGCNMFVYGDGAGCSATNTNFSIFMGGFAGCLATNSSNSNFLGVQAGLCATDAAGSNFLGTNSGVRSKNAEYSNFIGYGAGLNVTGTCCSNFLGFNAGSDAFNAFNSNFIGEGAGSSTTNANNSNFLGKYAGQCARCANNSNFLGICAGFISINANNSNFLGQFAGCNATNANNSNFLGKFAGECAFNACRSNFFGEMAGRSATNAGLSNLFGYNVGACFVGNNVGNNNIIIGTNISLPNATTDSINIGGVLFGTGAYSNTLGNPSIVPATNSRIGIGVVAPTNRFHVVDTSDPVKFEGLQSGTTDTRILSTDSSGVVRYRNLSDFTGTTIDESLIIAYSIAL